MYSLYTYRSMNFPSQTHHLQGNKHPDQETENYQNSKDPLCPFPVSNRPSRINTILISKTID